MTATITREQARRIARILIAVDERIAAEEAAEQKPAETPEDQTEGDDGE